MNFPKITPLSVKPKMLFPSNCIIFKEIR